MLQISSTKVSSTVSNPSGRSYIDVEIIPMTGCSWHSRHTDGKLWAFAAAAAAAEAVGGSANCAGLAPTDGNSFIDFIAEPRCFVRYSTLYIRELYCITCAASAEITYAPRVLYKQQTVYIYTTMNVRYFRALSVSANHQLALSGNLVKSTHRVCVRSYVRVASAASAPAPII